MRESSIPEDPAIIETASKYFQQQKSTMRWCFLSDDLV